MHRHGLGPVRRLCCRPHESARKCRAEPPPPCAGPGLPPRRSSGLSVRCSRERKRLRQPAASEPPAASAHRQGLLASRYRGSCRGPFLPPQGLAGSPARPLVLRWDLGGIPDPGASWPLRSQLSPGETRSRHCPPARALDGKGAAEQPDACAACPRPPWLAGPTAAQRLACPLRPPVASGPERADARTTWLSFLSRPDTGVPKKGCRGRGKVSVSQGLRRGGVCSHGGPLPPTVRSPGAPRAPGAVLTQEALLCEFRQMLTEATERRLSGLLAPLLPEGPAGRLLAEAFHCRLKGPVLVGKRTLAELQGFQAVSGSLGTVFLGPQGGCERDGAWPARDQGGLAAKSAVAALDSRPCSRGPGHLPVGVRLSLASGRFAAPVTSIFHFSASLHLGFGSGRGGPVPGRGAVRLLVCIESLCHRHVWPWAGRRGGAQLRPAPTRPVVPIQVPGGGLGAVGPRRGVHGAGAGTAAAAAGVDHGLGLQAGQYASVFVDNGSGVVLTVHSGSSFSGLLLGT
ncbi:Adipolin [Galemys pyrenaicus]|uniref:Adipolin n=1 Tax=Galemys pyrenaicus TaxID=202257 RepID=A0A8J6DCX2_GALPY|nr:Adipolin [Galemys pyrenaicus]